MPRDHLDDLRRWEPWDVMVSEDEVDDFCLEVICHLESCGATTKIGASSRGKRLDGTSFDTTMGRWRAHLGTDAKLTKSHTNLA